MGSLRSEAKHLHASAVEEMPQLEAEWQTRLTTLQDTHTKQLAAQAESFADQLELSAIRGIPDAVTLQKEARAVAKLGDFDAAESLFEQANSEQQTTIVQRQSEIRKVYDRLLVQLNAKQAEELRLHNEKRILKPRKVRAKYTQHVDKLKQQLANSAFRLAATRNEKEEDEIFDELADPKGGPAYPDHDHDHDRAAPDQSCHPGQLGRLVDVAKG
jgi:hypothetical protein